MLIRQSCLWTLAAMPNVFVGCRAFFPNGNIPSVYRNGEQFSWYLLTEYNCHSVVVVQTQYTAGVVLSVVSERLASRTVSLPTDLTLPYHVTYRGTGSR